MKLLLLGDSAVGKTSLLSRLADNAFSASFTATVGVDFKTHIVSVGGEAVRLQVWDTAGQERFHSLAPAFYRRCEGVLLVYDVTSATSLANVSGWLRGMERHASEGVARVVVGNKCDLAGERAVTSEEGAAVASGHGAGFLEASARTGLHVHRAFCQLAEAALSGRQPSSEGLRLSGPELRLNFTGCC